MKKSPAPVLNISQLSITRDGTKILREVNWRVERGQHWVILGANGSGKTSLLAALTGYFMPTSGDIDLLGQRYGESDWRDLRTHIGIVSSSIRQMMAETEPALDTVASGKYAMIDFWGTPSAADRAQAARLLQRVECSYVAARPWSVLSQGERQRVLIARALMARPSLLILDEPCAGLDPAAREHFLQFLNRLARQKNSPTLVLVTHHVEEITPIFTHVLMLKAGAVLASGPRRTILNSRLLSEAFAAEVRLHRSSGRFHLKVSPQGDVVV